MLGFILSGLVIAAFALLVTTMMLSATLAVMYFTLLEFFDIRIVDTKLGKLIKKVV